MHTACNYLLGEYSILGGATSRPLGVEVDLRCNVFGTPLPRELCLVYFVQYVRPAHTMYGFRTRWLAYRGAGWRRVEDGHHARRAE